MGRAGQFALGAAAVAVTYVALGSIIEGMFGASRAPRHADFPTASIPPPVWTDLSDAPRRYIIGANLFGREPDFYTARRHTAGGGRLDQLVYGSPAESGPYLRLTFYRPLDEPVGRASFWLEMARRAGEAGLALERSPPVPEIARSRIGPFEVGVLKATGAGSPRECLGFRQQAVRPELVISGIACLGDGAADPVFAREALVCALEAITLSQGEKDGELLAYFERGEEPVCGSGRPAPADG